MKRIRTGAALLVALAFAATAAAAQARADDATVRLSSNALRSRAVTCKVPAYNPRLHVRASVTVEIVIDGEGRVAGAEVVSGHPLLHAAAVQAAGGWTFRPVRVRGRRMRARGLLPLFFSFYIEEMERQCRGLRRAP